MAPSCRCTVFVARVPRIPFPTGADGTREAGARYVAGRPLPQAAKWPPNDMVGHVLFRFVRCVGSAARGSTGQGCFG